MWLKARAKLSGLPWYMVRAGEPQPLWAVGSELLNINSPVLYRGPRCDLPLLFFKGKGIAWGSGAWGTQMRPLREGTM